MRVSLWSSLVLAVVATGCVVESGPGGGGPGPWTPPPMDACPAGGTLRITLWDVYATPRKPSGEVWDGLESGTIELLCSATADVIRRSVREAVNSRLPGAGTLADRAVGEEFEREVADACGLASNWLQMSYEGPDLAAYGAFAGDAEWRWETVQVEDTWAARVSTTTAGGPAAWEIPCDATGLVAALGVVDRDLAFDDPVGNLGLDLDLPDELICQGWAYYEAAAGVTGVLVRLDVRGRTPVCP